MMGLFRTVGGAYNDMLADSPPLTQSPIHRGGMNVYDSDDESCSSTDSAVSVRGFVALIVSGPGAVALFEADYPTHYNRCHLARLISRGRLLSDAPYSVHLEEHAEWRVGSEFNSFMMHVIPASIRSDLAVYDVSDWDFYDYWNASSTASSEAEAAGVEEASAPMPPQPLRADGLAAAAAASEWTEFDTQQHDSPLPKRSRALETFTTRTFSLGRYSQSAHTSPLKSLLASTTTKRPWQRMSSQQTSPMLQSMQSSGALDASRIPRDLTLLTLATDAPFFDKA